MFLNGIDFPNQIVDAINNRELVVFAGAGASVDKPTSLPNFEKLTKEIAEGTGEVLKKKESCEVFLGNLKAKGIDVNQLASSILSTRYGLLSMFSNCVSKDIEWAKIIAQGLVERNISKQDIWQHLFYGLREADCSLDQVLVVFNIIINNAGIITDTNAASEYLWKMLQRPDMKEFFLQNEECIYRVAEVLWNHRIDEKREFSRAIDATLNTTVGNILFSWIYMISFLDMRSIPEKYIKYLDEALALKSWERNVSVCILVGHFNFFATKMLSGVQKNCYLF